MRGYTSIAVVFMLASFTAGLTLPLIWMKHTKPTVEKIRPAASKPAERINFPEPLSPDDDYQPHAWAKDDYVEERPTQPSNPLDDDGGIVMGMDDATYKRLPRDIRAVTRRIKHGHANSREYTRRAWLYISFGQPEKAARDATKAIRKNPQNVEAYAVRETAYFQMGKQPPDVRTSVMAIQ